MAAFSPPPLSSHEGPAKGFTPPPLESHEGPAPSNLSRAAHALYEGSGAKTIMDLIGGANVFNQAMQAKALETAKGVINGLAGEPARVVGQLSETGRDVLAGHLASAAYHLAGSFPLIGAPAQGVAQDLEATQYPEAIGHAAGLILPFAVGGATPEIKAAAQAISDSSAATAAKGAIVGGAKSAIEPVHYGHLRLPVPAPLAGAGAGGWAASQLGLPHEVGAVIGGATPIVRGMVKGAKSALKEKALIADAAKIPPEVMEELTRETAMPAEGGASTAGTPDIAVAPSPAAAPASPPAPVEVPAPSAPAAAPAVTDRAAAAADLARRLAQEGIESGTVPPTAEVVGDRVVIPGSESGIKTTAQAEAAMARKAPAPTEAPTSQYTATGERKSPQLRAAEITGANRTAKASRFVEALQKTGISAEAAKEIEAGRLGTTAIQEGATPRWGNIADFLGENEPSPTTIKEIMRQLKKTKESKP